MSEFKCPECGARLFVDAKKGVPKATSIEDVKALFPKLKEMLTFTESEDYYIVKPLQFLGKETFAKVAAIVREAKGEYISQGKESHFRIQKT